MASLAVLTTSATFMAPTLRRAPAPGQGRRSSAAAPGCRLRPLPHHDPVTALETSYLWPDPVLLLTMLLVVGVLVVWPLVDALRQGRYGWAVAIVPLAP